MDVIDEKIQKLMSLTSEFIFIEDYSHSEHNSMFKIKNIYSEEPHDIIILTPVSDGIEVALNDAILQMSEAHNKFFGFKDSVYICTNCKNFVRERHNVCPICGGRTFEKTSHRNKVFAVDVLEKKEEYTISNPNDLVKYIIADQDVIIDIFSEARIPVKEINATDIGLQILFNKNISLAEKFLINKITNRWYLNERLEIKKYYCSLIESNSLLTIVFENDIVLRCINCSQD